MKIHVPILFFAVVAICGFIRGRLEIQFHTGIDFEITALTALVLALLAAYVAVAIKKKCARQIKPSALRKMIFAYNSANQHEPQNLVFLPLLFTAL